MLKITKFADQETGVIIKHEVEKVSRITPQYIITKLNLEQGYIEIVDMDKNCVIRLTNFTKVTI